MTNYSCPQGHSSSSDDYCDVCGLPIDKQVAQAVVAPTAAAAEGNAHVSIKASTRMCPNCFADNAKDVLFCENCGYDFTTGQRPRPEDPKPGMPLAMPGVMPPGAPLAPPASAPSSSYTYQSTPVAVTGWNVEVWVDPDWHSVQDVPEPCPPAASPTVLPATSSQLLIGRTSVSRNIHPDIDMASDTGVSRRHAQLSTDGERWWVEDLQSANGTFVAKLGDPLPTEPIPAGQRVELSDTSRVYVGAWTRIVVRRAA